MRILLALSDGALAEQFVDNEDQVASLIKEQDRLTKSICFLDPSFQTISFQLDNTVQRTTEKFLGFLTRVEPTVLREVSSEDFTVTENIEIENFDEIQRELKNNVLVPTSSRDLYYKYKDSIDGPVYELESLHFRDYKNQPGGSSQSNLDVVSIYRVNIQSQNLKSLFMRTTLSATLKSVHFIKFWRVLLFDNGWYSVYDTPDAEVVHAEIGYANVLCPVKIDNNGNVEWAYWDEVEKVVRVSGIDGFGIPCNQKPHYLTANLPNRNAVYREFVVVNNKEGEILVVNPNDAISCAIIPRTQHALKRIDAVKFSDSIIQLFDLNSKRYVAVEVRRETYSCEVKHVGHWRESKKSAIVSFPISGRTLCVSFNVGTPEVPKISKLLLQ